MSEIKDLKPFEQRKQPLFKYPDGREVSGKLIDEVYVDSKVIDENTTDVVYKYLIQKISLENGEEVFRFCYYVINFDDTEPKWMFSKNALIVLEKEFKELLNKMNEKGWINITFN
ncbi:hypothetical protein LCGC14_0668060 [marine sediment metagenome]|uniref:Uncharacterized protein n=1 Tax=marine sediment metagenome TaxID=412755 RepID=A0A0F9QRS2_9ZZZZ